MVHRIGEFRGTEVVARAWGYFRLAAAGIASLPIERLAVNELLSEIESSPTAPRATAVATERRALQPALMRPGCTAADEAGNVLYHLQGLAADWGGFGVLALDLERLDRAAWGARTMGDVETARELEGFKERLPAVRSQEAAREAARDFVPIARAAWELGKKCGKGGQP